MAIGRVSTYQFNKSFASQVNNTQSKFNKLSQQITSGKKVTSVSDDAVAAKGIIKANSQLADIETYVENLKMADNELTQTDSTLKSINDQLQKAYDLAMTVSNGTTGADQMEAYRQELDSIIDNVTRLANTKYGDKYLFSGTSTTTAPYEEGADGMQYKGDNGARYVLVGEAKNGAVDTISDEKKQQINVIGESILGNATYTKDADGKITMDDANSAGVFKALYDLKAAIQNDPIDEEAARKTMETLNDGMEKVTAERTRTGALGKEFDDMQDAYANDTLSIKELKSNLEDTDLPSAISDWYQTYQSLQASYQMFAQTTNVSLLNFI